MAKKISTGSKADRVSFADVVAEIEQGTITQSGIDRYFVAAPDDGSPFALRIGINPDTVDVGNARSASVSANGLFRDASRVVQTKSQKKASAAKVITAEGDSWFQLPKAYAWTLIHHLQEEPSKYQILNLATPGDKLDQIILDGEFWPYIGDAGAQILMFSAGGNDILADVGSYLNLYDVDHQEPSQAAYYVRPEFYENLKRVCDNYEALIVSVRKRAPGTIMIGHGYGYAIPRPEGPWIGNHMLDKGLDPNFKSPLCRAIVAVMIDAFNDRLKAFAARHPNFVHADLRPATTNLSVNDWRDELHGKSATTKKFAKLMGDTLDNLSLAKMQRRLRELPPLAA